MQEWQWGILFREIEGYIEQAKKMENFYQNDNPIDDYSRGFNRAVIRCSQSEARTFQMLLDTVKQFREGEKQNAV
ncbi:hypothetical protein [Fictibacillus gelatini]|uniref:hypothetical protein n=1 Tax=Fictibacillus gelatini TaxID=225985 RepID=UPI00041D7839|nr:hypothetical protein [Fictibacillus gelatini]